MKKKKKKKKRNLFVGYQTKNPSQTSFFFSRERKTDIFLSHTNTTFLLLLLFDRTIERLQKEYQKNTTIIKRKIINNKYYIINYIIILLLYLFYHVALFASLKKIPFTSSKREKQKKTKLRIKEKDLFFSTVPFHVPPFNSVFFLSKFLYYYIIIIIHYKNK